MIRHFVRLCNSSVFTSFIKNEIKLIKRTIFIQHLSLLNPISQCTIQNIRFKSKNYGKRETETESELEEYDKQDEVGDKYTKILKINVTSLRVDAILKSSLGVARNRIEILFYESKIRLNGEKIYKKSATVQEGDEIDLIKGPDLKNPNFMNVARVEILSIKGAEDSISVKVKRCKSLLVDMYK